MKEQIYHNGRIFASVTLKDPAAPEMGNQALHVAQEPHDVLANQENLAALRLPRENWALLHQSHSDRLVHAVPDKKGAGTFFPFLEGDAIYTTDPDILIGVYTADCCGIVLFDESTPCLAIIHSGWKGTAKAIAAKTARHLIEQGLIHPENARVYFSPSLLYESLEVGPEVLDAISDMARKNSLKLEGRVRRGLQAGKYFIDNQGINKDLLTGCGIKEENIILSEQNTIADRENLFSFRRDKPFGEHFTYGYIRKEDEQKG